MGWDQITLKNYKRHYICLKCQKGFKRPSKQDMKFAKSADLSDLMNKYYASETKQDIVKYIATAFENLKVVCPNCKSGMLQVHYNFEVPSQRDKKSWKILKKEMLPKCFIKYDSYIFWHKLALKKEVKNSEKYKILKENLEKLEKISNS